MAKQHYQHIPSYGIYRTFYSTTADYTFLFNSHNMYSKVDYVLANKTDLNKCKIILKIQSMLSDHTMSVLCKLIYRCNAISIKIPTAFVEINSYIDSKLGMAIQRSLNCQNS